jgi:hypothetical protein
VEERLECIPETEIIILDIPQQVLLPIQEVRVRRDHQEVQAAERLTLTQAVLDEVCQVKVFQEVTHPEVLHTVAAVAAAPAE